MIDEIFMQEAKMKIKFKVFWPLLILIIMLTSLLFIGCSEEEEVDRPVDSEPAKPAKPTINVQEEKEQFINFLDNLELVASSDAPHVGMTLWRFTKEDKIVLFGSIESKIGDSWIGLFWIGYYKLTYISKDKYRANCHFKLKDSRWFPGNETIAQLKTDERQTVTLQRKGQKLLVNGVEYEKIE